MRSKARPVIHCSMENIIKYRGRNATADDIEFIGKLITDNPNAGRCALSRELCRQWNWIQPNGALRDMVARGFMLKLHREGYIELPPRKKTPCNPFLNRKKPEQIDIDKSPLNVTLKEIYPLEMHQVRRTPDEKLFNSLIEQYHYLGYTQPVGEHLKYMITANERPVACMAWSSAPRHIGARDRFIGWSPDIRQKNLTLMAYNSRFLILPWVKISHLASHILGRMAKTISSDWEKIYSHPVHYLETFVDTDLYKGTCYKAANWIYLGKTTGRGKNDQTGKPNRSLKAVYGYPLSKKFRQRLSGDLK